MRNFKNKLALFATVLTFVYVTAPSSNALDMGSIDSKTPNINMTSVTDEKFQLDMAKNAGKGAIGQLDWVKYNVPKNQEVKYGFSNSSQTIINRVIGKETSFIYGKITQGCSAGVDCGNAAATGKVLLINPNGVVMGAGSTVDLNSFTVSTKDIKGIKNLSSVTDMAAYQESLKNLGKNINFVKSSDGSTATIWLGNTDGTGGTHITADKSIAVISDNIVYRDSILKTTGDASNVKLITADGFNFVYDDSGKVTSATASTADATKTVKTINIDNTNIKGTGIESKDVEINANSKLADSYVQLKNTNIKATKLVADDKGNIYITGNKTLVFGGDINAQNDLTLKANATAQTSQNAKLTAANNLSINGKKATVSNTTVNAKDVNITASDKATLSSATVTASNKATVKSTNQMLIKNSTVNGAGEVLAESTKGKAFVQNSKLKSSKGSVTVKSDTSTAQVNKNSEITAKNYVSLDAKNVNVIDSKLSGNDVHTFNADKVTLKNTEANATNFVNLISDGQALIKNSKINGNSQVFVKSDSGNIFVENSKLNSSNGAIGIDATKGQVKVSANTEIQSAGPVNLYSKNNLIVENTSIKANNISLDSKKNTKLENSKLDTTQAKGDSIITVDGTKYLNGNVFVGADKQVVVRNSEINSKNDVNVQSTGDKVFVDASKVTSKDTLVTVYAASTAQVYKNSTLSAATTATVEGKKATVSGSTVSGKDVNIIASDKATLSSASVSASNKATVKSTNQMLIKNSTVNGANAVLAESTKGKAFLNGSKVTSKNGSVTVNAAATTQLSNKANITAATTATVNGKTANVISSTVSGKDVNVTASDTATLSSATVTASNKATVKSTNQMLIKNSTVNGANAVLAESTKGKAFVQKSNLTSSKGSVDVKSDVSTAQVYDGSKITAATTANVNGKTANVTSSTVSGKDVNIIASDKATLSSASVSASNKATVKSTNQMLIKNSTVNGANAVLAESTKGKAFLNGSKVTSKNGSVTVNAAATTQLSNKANITAATTATVNGKTANVISSTVSGKDVNVTASDTATLSSATVTASNKATVKSTNQMLIKNSTVNGANAVLAESTKGKAFVQNSKLNSSKGSVAVKSDVSTAQVNSNSNLSAATTATVNGKTANVTSSTVSGKDVNVTASDTATLSSATVTASNKATVKSTNQMLIKNSTVNGANAVLAESTKGKAMVQKSKLNSSKGSVTVKSDVSTAQVYDSSAIKAATTANVNGKTANVLNSNAEAKNINVTGSKNTEVLSSKLSADDKIVLNSTSDRTYVKGSTLTSKNSNVQVKSSKNTYVYDSTVKGKSKTAIAGQTTDVRNSTIDGTKIKSKQTK